MKVVSPEILLYALPLLAFLACIFSAARARMRSSGIGCASRWRRASPSRCRCTRWSIRTAASARAPACRRARSPAMRRDPRQGAAREPIGVHRPRGVRGVLSARGDQARLRTEAPRHGHPQVKPNFENQRARHLHRRGARRHGPHPQGGGAGAAGDRSDAQPRAGRGVARRGDRRRGPAGIAAGLGAIQHKMRYVLLEQESSLGGTVYHYRATRSR